MFQELVNQLSHTEPLQRIYALQVLAMLEETRALNAIHHLFKNDPDERVRQAAKWAGGLIWQAQQRGYSTEQAMKDYFDGQLSEKQRDAMVANLLIPVGDDRALKADMDALQTQWQHLDTMKRTPHTTQTTPVHQDDFDLLDAGLSLNDKDDDLDAGLSDLFK